MQPDEEVLVICVNYNGSAVLEETLKSLDESDYSRLRILVVDNASSDDSLSLISPGHEALMLEENRGYAGAINAALKSFFGGTQALPDSSVPEYFLLMNNDVTVESSTIGSLVEFARSADAGVFGPRVVRYWDPGKLEAAWGKITWSHVLAHYQGKGAPENATRWNRPERVPLLLGSCLLVHREVFKRVGLLDERFFMYHEEVDFLYRCDQHGVPVFYVPLARVFHRVGHATREDPLKKVFWVRRNTVLFFRKHGASSLQWSYFYFTLALSLLLNLLTFRWSRARTILNGVREGFE